MTAYTDDSLGKYSKPLKLYFLFVTNNKITNYVLIYKL